MERLSKLLKSYKVTLDDGSVEIIQNAVAQVYKFVEEKMSAFVGMIWEQVIRVSLTSTILEGLKLFQIKMGKT